MAANGTIDDSTCGRRLWLEEELTENIRVSMIVKSVLYSGNSEFQFVELLDSAAYGKVLLLDGKVQSTEVDEYMYHELLVHPPMLHHPNPKTVFIAGGGEGATVREVLRHKSVEKVVMVDIDKVVCDFCKEHLHENTAAFNHPKLELIHDDAYSQLENYPGKFDVIIADLADPLEGGPCYHLYTKEFYESVLQSKLNPGGIFVTQSGPAGILSCKDVFTGIHKTLESTFPTIIPYAVHIPSYNDVWGWNMAFTDAATKRISNAELDKLAAERIEGKLKMFDGETFDAASRMPKPLRVALAEEQELFTKDNPRFIHGAGMKTMAQGGPPVVFIKDNPRFIHGAGMKTMAQGGPPVVFIKDNPCFIRGSGIEEPTQGGPPEARRASTEAAAMSLKRSWWFGRHTRKAMLDFIAPGLLYLGLAGSLNFGRSGEFGAGAVGACPLAAAGWVHWAGGCGLPKSCTRPVMGLRGQALFTITDQLAVPPT